VQPRQRLGDTSASIAGLRDFPAAYIRREARLSKFLIALVEDDESVLEALDSLLDVAGYEVLTHNSAEDLLASARLSDIDLLITDIGLPGMSGIELLRLIRTRKMQLPSLVITARGEAAVQQAALEAGARRLFQKPLDNAELLETIEVLLT
jgi:FixJ family two-component response regulator